MFILLIFHPTMKRLLKRLGATIALNLLAFYQPKIEQMQKEGLKTALLLITQLASRGARHSHRCRSQ